MAVAAKNKPSDGLIGPRLPEHKRDRGRKGEGDKGRLSYSLMVSLFLEVVPRWSN